MINTVFLFMLFHSAHAVNCLRNSFEQRAMDVTQVANIDEMDRRTEKQYAAEKGMSLDVLKSKIAATGTITCPFGLGSANVVGTEDLIVTVGHALVEQDERACASAMVPPQDCTFTYQTPNGPKTVKVKSLVGAGFKCPGSFSEENDWAVLRLEEPADVQPYAVGATKVKNDTDLIVVGAQSSDFQVGEDGKIVSRHIGDCKARHTGPRKFFSNCDTGSGASGGATLHPNLKQPTILGIVSGNDETTEQEKVAIQRNEPITRTYDIATWKSIHTPIQGKFLSTILSGMEEAPSN